MSDRRSATVADELTDLLSESRRMRADIRTLAAAVSTLAEAVERFAKNPGAAQGAAELEIAARDVREHVEKHV